MEEPPSPKRNRHKSSSSTSSSPVFDVIWDNPNIWQPEEVPDSLLQDNADILGCDSFDAEEQQQVMAECSSGLIPQVFQLQEPPNSEYDPLEDPEVLEELDRQLARALVQEPEQLRKPEVQKAVDRNVQQVISRLLEADPGEIDLNDVAGPSWFNPQEFVNGDTAETLSYDRSLQPKSKTVKKQSRISNSQDSGFNDLPDEMWKAMLDQVGGRDPPVPQELDQYIHIEPQELKKISRFKTYMIAYTAKFRNIEQAADVEQLMYDLFEYLIRRTFTIAFPGSIVGVTVSHPALKDGDIYVPFCKQGELTPERIIREIEKVMQSNAELKYDSTMKICFTRVVQPKGGVRKQRFKGNLETWIKEKCGHGGPLIWINNQEDNLCLARAIVTARAHLHRNESPAAQREYQNVIRGDTNRNTTQKRRAKELMQISGLAQHQGKCGLFELEQIQRALPSYQIKVWDFPRAGCCIFRGPVVDQPHHVIYLFHTLQHFIPITRMAAFFEQVYYCETCEVPYKQQEFHRCENKCGCCQKQSNCVLIAWAYCEGCNRYFKSRDCFDNHKKVVQIQMKDGSRKETSICKRLWKCNKCNQLVSVERLRGKNHRCGFRYCSMCREFVKSDGHLCFMSVLKEKNEDDDEEQDREEDPDSLENLVREQEQTEGEQLIRNPKTRTKGWIFFDIECTQDQVIQETALGITFAHKPNLVIAHKICPTCKDRPLTIESTCEKCINRYHQFDKENCIDDFCKWLFQKEHKGYVAIAHNMKGYDGQFLLNFLHKNGIRPDIIPKGLEIMKLEVDGIKILDSLNFMPLPLASLPKAFGIEELRKGYFPHFFNKAVNQDYEGPYPDPQDYGVSTMKSEAREKFFAWYRDQKDKVFNLWQELVAYCNSDVDILRKACMEYRKLFVTETATDPFDHCMTIASTCNRVFRKNFLQEKTIGIVPPGGYSSHEKQSIMAKKWLHWIATNQNINIRYVANGKEIKVGQGNKKHKVDGQDQNNPWHIYEFNGCLWHGCRTCFKDRSALLPGGQKTVEEAYLDTIHRRQELIRMGFQIEEKWECDLRNDLVQNLHMQDFFNNMDLLEPLSPRAAFYGGRTNASVLYWKSKGPMEKARYLDVCSLYPYVCKYGEFPKGHPKVITENFSHVDKDHQPYKGLIECKILPPKQLLHPVLPVRCHGKLMFPLCQSCVLEQNSDSCSHTDAERTLKGTWCTPELYKALEIGYKMVTVLQVWHYEEWLQYRRGQNPNSGMFTAYIDCFVKHKQQASDWPRNQDREEYLREYKEHEGIQLDPNKIEKNPGLRFLAKLCLNSFWGKFGQRNDMSKVEYFSDPAKYFSCVFNQSNIIKRIDIVHENMVLVEYRKAEEYIEALPTTNPIIASFVTTHARLKLYTYLEQLGDRVLYYDTDSVIFISKPGEDPVTGCHLGDLTDELDDYGEGSYIEEFIGAGPKNYAYAVRAGRDHKRHETLKCRGFCLNYTAGMHLNFRVMKQKVQAFVQNGPAMEGTPITLPKIRRTRDRVVTTGLERKKYGVIYDKRRVLADFSTKPFGYVD